MNKAWPPERRAATDAYNRGELSLRDAAREAGVSPAQMCRSARGRRKAPTLAERRGAVALPGAANYVSAG